MLCDKSLLLRELNVMFNILKFVLCDKSMLDTLLSYRFKYLSAVNFSTPFTLSIFELRQMTSVICANSSSVADVMPSPKVFKTH